MSRQSIQDKSNTIRQETQQYGNTRGRVADVLDDIANTLVDQDDLNAEATARANADTLKLDKPQADGSYYIAKVTVSGTPYYQYRTISLSAGQIPVSRDSYIEASILYESVSGRIGVNTTAPSEKFEVYNGRIKADGFILTASTSAPLPKEIKYKGGNFVGAKDDGIEHKFLMSGDLDTELTNKLDKGGYVGTAQDLKNSIDGKLNKPTTTSNTTSYPFVVGEDGNGNSARLPAGDLGKNFFNSDLSNTTARNHTMNAGVTVNTLGNPHTLSGLPNKNADITNFRKVRVQNTSGLDSVVDSKNLLTDGMTSMSDAEKDAWRLAQRKTNETYSTGQPRVDTILPPVVNSSNDYIQYVTLVGLNLFINNSNPSTAMVKLKRYKDINSNTVPETVIDITNYQVYQQNASILSFGINYSTLQTGYYKVEVTHNGIVNIGTSDLLVSNTVNTNTIILDSWEVYTPFEPSNLIITPTSIKKTYGSVIRSSTVIEQQVKHFIINASDILSGFRLRFTYKLSPAGNELGNVKHRQSISFGLGYNKDVNATIVPEILISFIRGTLNIGNVFQPPLFVPYIYEIDIVVKNGLATVIVNLTNTGSVYTATFSFEQKNEQMFFYSTFLGSNPDSSHQIQGTTQELLFPTTYQSF